MKRENIENSIKVLDVAIEHSRNKNKLLDKAEKRSDGLWTIEFTQEEYDQILSYKNNVHSALSNTKAWWCDLLNEEAKLKTEYTQQVKLDRTIKINSFVLRVCTAFGVIVASVATLNIADKFGLSVPWIVSRHIAATELPKSENKNLDNIVSEKPAVEIIDSKSKQRETTYNKEN